MSISISLLLEAFGASEGWVPSVVTSYQLDDSWADPNIEVVSVSFKDAEIISGMPGVGALVGVEQIALLTLAHELGHLMGDGTPCFYSCPEEQIKEEMRAWENARILLERAGLSARGWAIIRLVTLTTYQLQAKQMFGLWIAI